MLMRVLDESPDTRVYHENNPFAFTDFQLRPDPVVRALAALHPAPCQVFKPICDSQDAHRLLERFPSARGLWIFRQPGDVARSAVNKWGDHQREVVDAIAAGDLRRWGWRTRHLPADVVASVRAVHRPDLSAYEGALLFWWIRNRFFFSLGLDRHPRVLPLRYEDLVGDPEKLLPEVFAHVGARFSPRFTAQVHSRSLRGEAGEEASPEIRALCARLHERLVARVRAPSPAPVISPVMMIIDTLRIGGAERYVVMVSNWMARAGVEVTVAARSGEFVEDLAPEVTYVDVPLVQVRAALPTAAAKVARVVRGRPPAAIVAHSLATTWVARLATAGRAIPVVTVAHGWPEHRYAKVAPLMRAAHKVVAVSPEVRDKLVGAGLDPERCVVIENGIDSTEFGRRHGELRTRVRAEMGAGPDDLLVILVGRLMAQKAHHHVFSIAERLRGSHPRVRFAVVGTGDRAEELANRLEKSGQQDRVRLVGVRQDVPDLVGSADIYLSCSDWEGMPLTTIEAMVAELPCVATRTEGTSLLLGDGCGIVVPVGDVEGMADGIARLADDPDLRRQMGAAARRRALERFGHDRVSRELMAVLDQVCHRRD